MKRKDFNDMDLFLNATGFHYGWKFTAMGAAIVLAVLFLAAVGEALGNAIAALF